MGSDVSKEAIDTLRLDKWLWYARFLKSRSLAAKLCTSGKVRINSQLIKKARQVIKVDDVITFPLGDYVRVIKVVKLGVRRGPAEEAQALYEDLEPPQPKARKESEKLKAAVRDPGSGRPTKAERRAMDRLKPDPGEY